MLRAPAAASALLILWPLVLAGTARADSSVSSAASHSASTSVGSVSNSLQHSSDGSSRHDDVAAGEYRIVDIAAAPAHGTSSDGAGRTAVMRLHLQAVAGSGAEGEFFLYVPQDALSQAGLVAGRVVSARTRPYGVEFAHGQAREAFFLLLADDWFRELRTQAVRG
jgi:hypothetical protein